MTLPAADPGPVIERLIRIETKQDISMTQQSDHEVRIRRLERSVWIMAGAAAAGGSVIGTLIGPLIGQ